MTTCAAKYEPGQDDRETHTCCKRSGHEGWHICPLCRSVWERPYSDVWRAVVDPRERWRCSGSPVRRGEYLPPVRFRDEPGWARVVLALLIAAVSMVAIYELTSRLPP
jgi:hypothetical protein